MGKELNMGCAYFLVDTGADINIIKLNALDDNVSVALHESVAISGITPDTTETLGTTIITLLGKPVKFHVVRSSFVLRCDGILGKEYLTQEQAEISFTHNTLVTRSDPIKPIPFIGYDPVPRSVGPRLLYLKARTRQAVAIDVTNHDLKEGYLPKIETIDGLYIGEAVVSVNDRGACHVFAVNTTDKDVEVEIPPQELIPFEYHNFSEEEQNYFDSDTEDETLPIAEDRVLEIIKKLRLDHLNEEERDHVIKVIKEFPERFHLPCDKLPCTSYIKHRIPTVDDVPVNTRQYRFPPVHKDEIEKQVRNKLNNGIIAPSNSPYNSPIWIVPKKPDSKGNLRWRIVIDFRNLNEKTIGDAYPLPNITDILDHLGEARYFSTFDLASGFQQIEMDPKDRQKTAFTTPNGHYMNISECRKVSKTLQRLFKD